jgi:hypothetical protein
LQPQPPHLRGKGLADGSGASESSKVRNAEYAAALQIRVTPFNPPKLPIGKPPQHLLGEQPVVPKPPIGKPPEHLLGKQPVVPKPPIGKPPQHLLGEQPLVPMPSLQPRPPIGKPPQHLLGTQAVVPRPPIGKPPQRLLGEQAVVPKPRATHAPVVPLASPIGEPIALGPPRPAAVTLASPIGEPLALAPPGGDIAELTAVTMLRANIAKAMGPYFHEVDPADLANMIETHLSNYA